MNGQSKFNPVLVAHALKLQNINKELSNEIHEFLNEHILHPSIVCSEIEKAQSASSNFKRPRLEYLQLNRQKPKAIPTFAPEIDADFLISGHWKERRKNDESLVKKRLKKAEKDAVRELKKDTATIMAEKAKM